MKRLTPRTAARARLSAALSLVALAAVSAAVRARAQAEQTYWVDGYEVEAVLRPLRSAFVLGEPVMLSLDFKNNSDTDLELMLSGDQGRTWPDDFDVSVIGPDGRTLPRPQAEEGGRANYDNLTLPVARNRLTAVVGVGVIFDLGRWATVDQPGVYTVTYRRGLRAGPKGARYRLRPGTTKPAVELRVRAEVNVVEGGPERTGKLVEDLAAAMLECNRDTSVEAATRLASMKDARGVKYLVEALGKCRGNPSIRYQALGGLPNVNTDEAFDGLRLAASDADEDFRTVAAQHISQSKHPKARGLLLSLRKDPYFGVRVVVLSALEALDTEEARSLIWEMTNDEHPLVKAEALRFLQERAGHPPRP